MPSLRLLFRPILRPTGREFLGALIAPIVPGVVIGGVIWLRGDASGGRFAIMVAAYLSYLTALLAGVPLYLILQWRRWHEWPAYIAAGGLLGLIVCAKALVDLSRTKGVAIVIAEMTMNARSLLLLVVYGMFAAWCFWLIARPDRISTAHAPSPAN